MSIEQSDKVDFIGINKELNTATLVISDHLDWTISDSHLEMLQDKLNGYLSFIESNEIYDAYPKAKGKDIIIEVIGKYPLNEEAEEFYRQVNEMIGDAGIDLRFKLLEEE